MFNKIQIKVVDTSQYVRKQKKENIIQQNQDLRREMYTKQNISIHIAQEISYNP